MQEYQTVFQRREIKYLLKAEQYIALLQGLEPYMQPDHYGKTTVHSLYPNEIKHITIIPC